ncbi:MAG: GNAT family N-acetyltransferase [Lachnospiraceae bacterium]|nr:GNAT family N-acetyltransferase [Lachnospiraceae bacterium]
MNRLEHLDSMNFRIETDRLIMRVEDIPMAEDILDFYIRNKDHLAPYEPDKIDSFYTVRYHQTALQLEMKKTLEGSEIRYYLYEKKNPDFIIGVVNLYRIVRGSFDSATIAYKLDQKHTGKGYAFEAVMRLMQLAYEDLHLHRVECRVVTYNDRSIRLLEKAGFSREGLERQTVRIGGKWEDTYRYAYVFEE